MLSPSSNFSSSNTAIRKKPMHLLTFDGVDIVICDHKPSDLSSNYRKYLVGISGIEQNITPEKGTASIGSLKFSILDKNQEITAMMATDTTFFHRKKVTLKSGYVGNAIADLMQEYTGWITEISRGKNGLTWEFVATDPQKWLQKVIFRNASGASPYTLAGNPINILLTILTSSAAGTNSDYDYGNADYGCGLDSDSVNIASIELVRNQRFWGQTHNLYFTITEKISAKEFIETEILQLLNCYPQIDGQGRYLIVPFAPPVATRQVQSFSETQNIDGNKLPSFDMNLKAMINEIDLKYDFDGSDYQTSVYYVDGTSYNSRGPSAKPLEIKSAGLKTNISPWSQASHAADIIERRKDAVFARWAVPPIKIDFESFLKQRLTESGDIVPFAHSKLPDVESGTLGLSVKYMEVIKRSVDRKNGKVKISLLDTGFSRGTYSAMSPYMTITAASSATGFTVSLADAALWTEGWEAKIVDNYMNIKASSITILTINTSTGAITCDDIGVTPTAGWHVIFADYDNATNDQKKYGFCADSNGYLGADNSAGHLLSA
ncbi:MAG: hypothetical protein ACU83N_10010 [Gammaproteobacteria bacterium]